MPHDRTDYISGWSPWGILFYQLYHSPISEMKFWVCGLADGDYIDLDDYFEELLTAHVDFCSMNGAAYPQIVGTNLSVVLASGGNATWIQIFGSSGYRLDVQVTGHKAECAAGLS